MKRAFRGGTWLSVLLLAVLLAACTGTREASDEPQPEGEPAAQSAYGPISQKQSAGSISSVIVRDNEGHSYAHVEQLLIGRVPGLRVLRTPDGGYRLQIRGQSTFLGSEDPLIVVDGMPMLEARSALRSISPSDVARIDVLKDAGTTAIYGVRGANGVILITTKRGVRRER